jgi:D-alanyl-D-alanine dipeptidase
MALRPWSPIPIEECGEALSPLPAELLRIQPHPYVAIGAPYGSSGSPFRLRDGVIRRLLEAQRHLDADQPGWRLAIFDAWRPLAVQRFMIGHAIAVECSARGVDPSTESSQRLEIEREVARFWAPPSEDPATPPPHSTGAAVDLTLADAAGALVDMGSAIDAIGAVSEPEHFAGVAAGLADAERRRQALLWHGRRSLLARVMAMAGFAQHPNEWWHFSWGDQLWAWRGGSSPARYGRWPED